MEEDSKGTGLGNVIRLDDEWIRDHLGGSWQHTLCVDKTLIADPKHSYPRLIDGAGRCPPEDCGGISRFYALLKALGDRSPASRP